MIRSTKISLKFSNENKLENLQAFIKEYQLVTSEFIDILWNLDKIPALLSKEIINLRTRKTWLSARTIQCSGKQASAIVRGTKLKQSQRQYRISKLLEENNLVEAKKLQLILDKNPISKPDKVFVKPELDSRFIKVDFNPKTKFVDGWISLKSLGYKTKLELPFRKTSNLNKLLKQGKLLGGIRLLKSGIDFNFEIETPVKKTTGNTVGIDIGKIVALSISNNTVSKPNKHGHDLNTILKVLSRKQKGSHGFQRASEHRKNYINWSVNQLNFSGIKEIKLEKIKNLRKGKHSSRMLSHWNYTEIFGKLERKCEELGVQVSWVSPAFTSQRCSDCGWTQESNRTGTLFKCKKCLMAMNADLNASKNIAFNLRGNSKERLLQNNKDGFYLLKEGQEQVANRVVGNAIVPDVKQLSFLYFSI